MDSFMQRNEQRNDEMEGIAGEQMRDAEEVNAGLIMQPEMFLAEQQNGDVAFRDEMQELRDRTTAVLEKIKKGKKENAKSTEELIKDFLKLKFSTRELKADYVIQHLDICLQNIELIRCVKELEHQMDREAYAPVKRKLEAVKEYPDVVESALWKYGLRINFDTFEVMEINENDENFAKRRRAYLAGGSWRYSFGVKRCSWMKKYPEFFPNNARLTRVEEMLSAFEAELDISIFREGDMRIVQSCSRSVGKPGSSEPEDVIRADGEDAQGKMEDRQVKMRFHMIYHGLKKRLEANFPGWAEDFQLLERFVEAYVCLNREIYDDRRAAEEREAKVFGELKEELVRASNSTNYQCSKYATALLGLLTEESSGYLEIPADDIHVIEDKDICLGNKRIPGKAEERMYRDCAHMPLFTHRPNIKDIEQGNLGDCYLLAGLISVVDQNSEEIMNIMRDNGDGTVTVCFKVEGLGKNNGKVFTPCYITVRKTIPVLKQNELKQDDGSDAFSRGALWVKMIEKAYVASGLHTLIKVNATRKENEDHFSYSQWQEYIKNGCYTLDYDDIWGGRPGKFTGLLLGKEDSIFMLDKNRLDHVAERIHRLLPPINVPMEDQYDEQEFGKESVDPFVYEFLFEKGNVQELACLKLQEPMSEAGEGVLMKSDENPRDKLQRYRKTCMIYLDIADTLIRNDKKFLKLKSSRAVNKWYNNLVDMFRQYKQMSANPRIRAKRRVKEISEVIQSVLGNYVTPEFRDLFSKIEESDFEITVKILRQRHLRYIARKKRNEPEEEGEGNNQLQGRYYTARDLELYESINKSLQSGAYVSFGTRVLSDNRNGRNGESMHRGLVGTHAYSLINTRRIMVNNEEQLCFVVMNPWAELGLIYHVGEHGITAEAIQGKNQGEKEEGVFLLNLKTFAEVVSRWEAVPARN